MSFLENINKYVKSGESRSQNLGLEIEHFVIDENGAQIGFEEVTSLIEKVGKQIGAELIYIDGHPAGRNSCLSGSPFSETADTA